MLMLERQTEIYQYLKTHKFATVDQLASLFYVGPASIRRDLKKLEEQQTIRRTHGGAVFLEGFHSEVPMVVRQRERVSVKEQIGKLAAAQVREGDIIFLDSSTTALAMAAHLHDRTVTILTNSLKLCSSLSDSANATVYLCGGRFHGSDQSVVGSLTVRFLEEFRVQKVFFSCRAMSADGILWDHSEEDAALRTTILRPSAQVYFLCDSVKIGQESLHRVCSCEALDYLLTEQPPADAVRKILDRHDVQVLLAK